MGDDSGPVVLRLIGSRMRRIREDAGLTGSQLGERIGLSITAIRNIEVGESGSHPVRLTAWADACRYPTLEALKAADLLLAAWPCMDPTHRRALVAMLEEAAAKSP